MFTFVKNLRVAQKLFVLISLFVAGIGVFALLSRNTLNTVKVNGPIY